MAEEKQLKEQINAVVEARELALEATMRRVEAYKSWAEANQQLLDNEGAAKTACQRLKPN